MSRIVKQILYGIGYLILIIFIAMGIYTWYLKPAPSCHDGIQDQGEQGIDCGGPCGNVCVAALQPIATIGTWVFPNSANHATVLAEIANPNANAGVQMIPYTIDVYDAANNQIASLPGSGFLYPSETQYVTFVNTDVAGAPVTANIMIASSAITWVPSSTMGGLPDFTFQNILDGTASSGTLLTVNGALVNQEPSAFLHVQIVAVFKDVYGNPAGASMTTLDNVPANSSVPFSVSYPAASNIDPTRTDLEAYATR